MYDFFAVKHRTQRFLAETGGLVKENVGAVEAMNLLTLFVFPVSFAGKKAGGRWLTLKNKNCVW
ncbi:MAG: hypothetical protein PHQ63_05095, partial [Smithellaceae bacterium]|nr:hypothetical protein [Smithellaceae bacterium]